MVSSRAANGMLKAEAGFRKGRGYRDFVRRLEVLTINSTTLQSPQAGPHRLFVLDAESLFNPSYINPTIIQLPQDDARTFLLREN